MVSDIVDSFGYVHYLEFTVALLYYCARVHGEAVSFKTMLDLWSLHCLRSLAKTRILDAQQKHILVEYYKRGGWSFVLPSNLSITQYFRMLKKTVGKYYRRTKSKSVTRYYNRISSILGDPSPVDWRKWISSFIDKVSVDPPFFECKNQAKKIVEEIPPRPRDRDLISLAAAYLHIACNMNGKKMSLAATQRWLNQQLTGRDDRYFFEFKKVLAGIVRTLERRMEIQRKRAHLINF